MPSKNSTKIYVENGYYHLYNRGVDKRAVFLNKADCAIFLRFLKQYLSPKEDLPLILEKGERLDRFMRSNMYGEIELLAFALMPNHFHLLVKQTKVDGISKFMNRLCTSYVMYFNKKYERVGHLFQDQYKGILVTADNYILHLSRYIHLNPRKIPNKEINFEEFTSYSYYMEEKSARWLKPDFILDYFSGNLLSDKYDNSYRNFVEEYDEKLIESSFEELVIDLDEDWKDAKKKKTK